MPEPRSETISGICDALCCVKVKHQLPAIHPITMEKLAQTNHAREKRNLDLFRMLMIKGIGEILAMFIFVVCKHALGEGEFRLHFDAHAEEN